VKVPPRETPSLERGTAVEGLERRPSSGKRLPRRESPIVALKNDEEPRTAWDGIKGEPRDGGLRGNQRRRDVGE